jgi:hypothetical protein
MISSGIVSVAAQAGRPVIYPARVYVDAGGLMSFAASAQEQYVRAAALVDKILRGSKPADLPVEGPNTFELVVNLRASTALGLTIPVEVAAQVTDWVEWPPERRQAPLSIVNAFGQQLLPWLSHYRASCLRDQDHPGEPLEWRPDQA